MHELVGEARRRVEHTELPPRPGAKAGLLLELAPRRDVGVLLGTVVGDIESPGRDLEECRIRRQPPLANERHAIFGVERDDRHRPGVARDVPDGA